MAVFRYIFRFSEVADVCADDNYIVKDSRDGGKRYQLYQTLTTKCFGNESNDESPNRIYSKDTYKSKRIS